MDQTAPAAGLSASTLKLLAALSMLIDHTAAILVPEDSTAYFIMRLIGRLAFPIFAFFVAEGCRKTHDRRRYLLRLSLFALAAQLPFSIAFGTWGGTVLLTFALAVLAVLLFDLMREREAPALGFLLLLPVLAAAALLHTDYGWMGVAAVLFLYLCPKRCQQLLVLGLWLLYFYAGRCIPALGGTLSGDALATYLPQGLCACLSLPLLACYSGERGRGGTWFFYWFYPLHLFILWLLSHLI